MATKLFPLMCCPALPLFFLAGCNRSPEPFTLTESRTVMGTVASVTAVAKDPTTAAAAVQAGYARLDDVNRLMSDYRDDSEIGRLNRLPAGQPLMVSPETFHVIEKALAISEASGGAFDVTCRPVVQLWKEAGKRGSLPDRSAIDEALARVGWRKVGLNAAAHSVVLKVTGMQIDLGAIAKGYALDLAAEAMRKAGATSCLVKAGGDVLAIGTTAEGRPWRIGIQHPFQEGLFGYLSLTNRAVATSGKQLRFVIIDGKRYSHIVDPRTGWPAEQAPSVTVIASDGLTADAWATAFSVLTVSEGQELAARLPNIEVLWIWGSTNDVHTAKTPGFDRYLPAA